MGTKTGVCAAGMGLVLMLAGTLLGAETTVLRETPSAGTAIAAIVELKAEGQYRPQVAPGEPEAKPLELRVETRLDIVEKVLKLGASGEVERSVRRVNQAAAAVNGKVRTFSSTLRPEVALLVAARREGGIVTFSPGGPLTRPELELVQAAGDPMALADLLPGKEVGVGDTWPIRSEAARALAGYDALASNTLKAKVTSVDDARVQVKLAGEVRGAENGAEGAITIDGHFTFDRKAGLIDGLTVKRHEVRQSGPVGAGGLDIDSTLTVERHPVEVPAELSEAALSGVPLEYDPQRLLLQFSPPDGAYTLLHDRDWHLYWDDTRLAVLKRLDHGEVVAQCNLSIAPEAGAGRHQDTKQFHDDVRQAIGKRFVAFLGEGEVEGGPAGGYRYKITAQGREGDLSVLWHYYLLASPRGQQILATFTLPEAQLKAFGDQDGQMVGSLEWKAGAKKAD